jgi:hypothetical protein
MLYDKVNNGCQEHQDRYFINGVHGAQVKIIFAVRVLFTEKVGSHLREIK